MVDPTEGQTSGNFYPEVRTSKNLDRSPETYTKRVKVGDVFISKTLL